MRTTLENLTYLLILDFKRNLNSANIAGITAGILVIYFAFLQILDILIRTIFDQEHKPTQTKTLLNREQRVKYSQQICRNRSKKKSKSALDF